MEKDKSVQAECEGVHHIFITTQNTRCRLSKIQEFFVHNNPKELRACRVECEDREREHARKSFELLPQGYCERKTPKS